MRTLPIAFVALALMFSGVAAQAQTDAVTASCKDGSTQTGTSRRTVCRGHGGLLPTKAAAAAPAATGAPSATDTATPPATGAAPLEQTAPATAATTPKPRAARRSATPVAARTPDNPGDVWVNSATKIYHCPGTRPYGRTKAGSFMTEAAAKAAGDRPSHNRACTAAATPAKGAAAPAAQ